MLHRLQQVDLRLLNVFATVVRHGSFTAAQAALNKDQSTVSIHMANLEKRLGMRLCERGRRGFRLTPNGQQVYEALQRLDRSLDAFVSEIEATRGSLMGDIHVAAPSALASGRCSLLAEAIARFGERQGDAHFNLHVCPSEEIEVGVLDGRYDVGISTPAKRVSGLEHVFLYEETQSLYCGVGHELFERPHDGLSDGDILGYSCVRHSLATELQKPFDTATQALASSSEASVNFILSGMYIGYLPDDFAMIWVDRGQLKPIKPELYRFQLDVGLLLRKNRAPFPSVNAFIEDFLTVCSGEMPLSQQERVGRTHLRNSNCV